LTSENFKKKKKKKKKTLASLAIDFSTLLRGA
jgi:hypothetical protein